MNMQLATLNTQCVSIYNTGQASSLLLPSLSSAFPFHFLPSPSLSSSSLLCRLHKYIVVKVLMEPQFYDVNEN